MSISKFGEVGLSFENIKRLNPLLKKLSSSLK
jgi:hypothetical protein